MQITIFGATGMVGKHVVRLALAKNYIINAFGRNVQTLIDHDLRNDHLNAIKGYVFDEEDVYHAVKGSNAVISVLGGAFDGTDKTRSLGIKNIISQMQKTGVQRIVALGGSGVLQADEDTLIMDQPDYPEELLAVSAEHLQAYLQLKQSPLDWTFVCAPAIKEGDTTGQFTTAKDYPSQVNKGTITAGDLAMFMLDETTRNKYLNCRVGISN